MVKSVQSSATTADPKRLPCRPAIELADDNFGLIHVVPFIPHHLGHSKAQSWFICTLRDIAVPANHFLASFDSNGPIRVLRIPGDFHSFCPHDILPCLLSI